MGVGHIGTVGKRAFLDVSRPPLRSRVLDAVGALANVSHEAGPGGERVREIMSQFSHTRHFCISKQVTAEQRRTVFGLRKTCTTGSRRIG